MVGIDPERVSTAGQRLRQNVATLDDIEVDIRVALTRSGMSSPVLATVDDIEYELSSLDQVLQTRTNLALGFQLALGPARLTEQTTQLWNHLLDPRHQAVADKADPARQSLLGGLPALTDTAREDLAKNETAGSGELDYCLIGPNCDSDLYALWNPDRPASMHNVNVVWSGQEAIYPGDWQTYRPWIPAGYSPGTSLIIGNPTPLGWKSEDCESIACDMVGGRGWGLGFSEYSQVWKYEDALRLVSIDDPAGGDDPVWVTSVFSGTVTETVSVVSLDVLVPDSTPPGFSAPKLGEGPGGPKLFGWDFTGGGFDSQSGAGVGPLSVVEEEHLGIFEHVTVDPDEQVSQLRGPAK